MIFGRLGGLLGILDGLGASFWDLGASWAVLTAVDAPGGAALDFTGGLGSVFGSILGAQSAPRRSPKRPKNDQKIVLKMFVF